MSDKTPVATQLSMFVSETDSEKSVEEPTNFIVDFGSQLKWEQDITLKSRLDVYNSLWIEGTLPTRDDLRDLPEPGNWAINEFWEDFRVEAVITWEDDQNPDEIDCEYLQYADMIEEWEEITEPQEIHELLDRLSLPHFIELAKRMKDWADSDDFYPEESDWFETYASSYDYAFWFFSKGCGADWGKDIGVLSVEGYHPGCNAQIAELELPIEEANRRAIELGIPVRFREEVDQLKQKEEPVRIYEFRS